jgi:Ca-activated chloride channel family protein
MISRPSAIVLLIILVVASAHAGAQHFTSRALAVRVDVLVTDGRQPVTGLTARDFQLKDDGVVQPIAEIDHEQLPLNLILVFDTSSSVAGARMRALVDAGQALVDQMRDGDRVAVVSFASRVRLLTPLTPSRQQVRGAFAALEALGATSLRDAAFAALALRGADPGRTLLLIFSDGNDTSSWLSSTQVIEAARRTDAVVYAVAVTRQRTITRLANNAPGWPGTTAGMQTVRQDSMEVRRAGSFLEKLTRESGGRILYTASATDLRSAFTRTLAEFRDRYVLSYTPTGVGASGWHRLEVALEGKKGKVTARRGYFAE